MIRTPMTITIKNVTLGAERSLLLERTDKSCFCWGCQYNETLTGSELSIVMLFLKTFHFWGVRGQSISLKGLISGLTGTSRTKNSLELSEGVSKIVTWQVRSSLTFYSVALFSGYMERWSGSFISSPDDILLFFNNFPEPLQFPDNSNNPNDYLIELTRSKHTGIKFTHRHWQLRTVHHSPFRNSQSSVVGNSGIVRCSWTHWSNLGCFFLVYGRELKHFQNPYLPLRVAPQKQRQGVQWTELHILCIECFLQDEWKFLNYQLGSWSDKQHSKTKVEIKIDWCLKLFL